MPRLVGKLKPDGATRSSCQWDFTTPLPRLCHSGDFYPFLSVLSALPSLPFDFFVLFLFFFSFFCVYICVYSSIFLFSSFYSVSILCLFSAFSALISTWPETSWKIGELVTKRNLALRFAHFDISTANSLGLLMSIVDFETKFVRPICWESY